MIFKCCKYLFIFYFILFYSRLRSNIPPFIFKDCSVSIYEKNTHTHNKRSPVEKKIKEKRPTLNKGYLSLLIKSVKNGSPCLSCYKHLKSLLLYSDQKGFPNFKCLFIIILMKQWCIF